VVDLLYPLSYCQCQYSTHGPQELQEFQDSGDLYHPLLRKRPGTQRVSAHASHAFRLHACIGALSNAVKRNAMNEIVLAAPFDAP
jgi:hypothetical protein